MPIAKGTMPRLYTLEEKTAIVTKVEKLLRAGLSKSAAIEAAGTNCGSYANWVRAGIRPTPRPTPVVRSPEERARLVAAVQAHVTEGLSVVAACREVGIREERFYLWRKQLAPPPPMRPVQIEAGADITALVPVPPAAITFAPSPPEAEPPAPPVAGLALVAPGGYRVEGLDVETAAALLRALA
jgi:transposase-like protein